MGGVSSIVIYGILTAFTVVRFQKMITRDDPIVYQVGQRFDLNDPDSPTYRFEESQFRMGYGMYAIDLRENDENQPLKKIELDVQNYF